MRLKTERYLKAGEVVATTKESVSYTPYTCDLTGGAHPIGSYNHRSKKRSFYIRNVLGKENCGYSLDKIPFKQAREHRLMMLAMAHTLWHDKKFESEEYANT